MSTLLASTLMITPFAEELTWTPEAMLNTRIISDVRISPDHAAILFVATEAQLNETKGVSFSRIYKASFAHPDQAVLFSADDLSCTQPCWSPDGKWVAFLAKVEGIIHLYLIHSDGGKAIPLVTGTKDVQTFAWSPNSQKIAFVMADETELEKNREKTSLAEVYQQESTINRLWLIDPFASEPSPRPLTTDAHCVRGNGDFGTTNTEFDWSPDSQEIVFTFSPKSGLEYFYLDSTLATLHIPTGKTIVWEKKAPFEAMPRFSPDGQWVACITGSDVERFASNRQLAIRSRDGKQFRLLAKTPNEGPFLAGPSLLGWSHEGNDLLFFEPKGTKYHLLHVPVDGKPAQRVTTGDLFFKEPHLSYDRTMIGFVAQTPAVPPEAYIAKLSDFKPVQVSHLNQALLAYPSVDTQVLSWMSTDGLPIEGLLTYPIDFKPGKQYPLLVFIHGGPMGFFDETYLGTPNPYPLAAFAQAGFLVFRPNPRGSCGYGKSFRCANYSDWGGMDWMDIQSGIDALIAKGIVDADRMGVMGWSYGGYMTAWAITQTSRFKAASMGAGLCNLVSMNGTTDVHSFLTDYFGDYTVHRTLYEERSPLNHVQNVTTPCLIQHGTDDKRVPVAQSYEFYHALKRVGQNPTLVLYPGMQHRISDPNMQLDAMTRNLEWFQHHLIEK